MARYKRKSRNQRDNIQFKYKTNEYIRAERLLVIDSDGEQLGELSKSKALEIAQSQDLDLVEVAPNANPPVAKIISWSKFKYDQNKKKKESKSKNIEQKEMWFSVHIDKGDLEHKLKRVYEFLEKKHPVKITIRSKGRTNRENFTNLMDRILELLGEKVTVDSHPKFEGRNYAVIVKPAK